MNKDSKAILTKGLLEGYVGKSVRGTVVRSGFNLEASDYEGPEGKYHDEWAASTNGGGQELTKAVNGEKATRVYAGGTLSTDKLIELGITEKDVISRLVSFVNEIGDGTRLDTDTERIDGAWRYSYKVLKSIKVIPVDLGEEEIRFNDTLVFLHYHIISPVK